MNGGQRSTPERPATDRAEELLSHLGQRFSDMRTNMGRALEDRARQQQSGRANGQSGAERSSPRRAEETLTDWGERVGYFAGVAGLRLRQWGARAREEAEDLWAEAQSVREQRTAGSADTVADTMTDTTKEPQSEPAQGPDQMDESAQPS